MERKFGGSKLTCDIEPEHCHHDNETEEDHGHDNDHHDNDHDDDHHDDHHDDGDHHNECKNYSLVPRSCLRGSRF